MQPWSRLSYQFFLLVIWKYQYYYRRKYPLATDLVSTFVVKTSRTNSQFTILQIRNSYQNKICEHLGLQKSCGLKNL